MKSKPAYKFIFSFILLIVTLTLKAQVYTVQGKITNTKGDGLPYATIKVKGLQFGTTSREDGSYSLHLNAGNYHLLISAVGFKTLDFPIKVQDSLQKDIVLEEETKDLSEVVIKVKARDRAEEIMR